MTDQPITLYALSTCVHCKKVKEYLDKTQATYSCVYVDKATGDERRALVDTIKKHNPKLSFPTVVVGELVIVGYNEAKLKEALR